SAHLLPSQGVHLFWWTPHASEHSTAKGAGKFALTFQGTNSLEKKGLWATDGTAEGTQEIPVKNASANGVTPMGFPRRFGALGDRLFFWGINVSGKGGLWATDGTSKGTVEILAKGTGPRGLDPQGFFPFEDKLFFRGMVSLHKVGLWRTDGTAAGTIPLKVAGAGKTYGLNPNSFAELGPIGSRPRALFFSGSTEQHSTLWKTDGTSQGTVPIIPVANSPNLAPRDIISATLTFD
ncbi:hypothetical protein, partial [Mesorhizobium sp. M0768]|uniref:hypothetical protein n=1 Tax=Mesorhizobium sp. M0768 TaxID=2956996 RepID=UPI003335CF28